MKRLSSTGLNKEKLIFLGAAALLGISVYSLFASAPLLLAPAPAVSTLSAPAPLETEKADSRIAEILYYIEGGVNAQARTAVVRDRNNPFAPVGRGVVIVCGPKSEGAGPGVFKNGIDVPPQPPNKTSTSLRRSKESPHLEPKVAGVDFSGVVTMNNVTYGLLKSKSGQTIQVREGDYLDDYKYTVARIEKQAILFSDSENEMYVARDRSFD